MAGAGDQDLPNGLPVDEWVIRESRGRDWWLAESGAPKPELENEKPSGRTIRYEIYSSAGKRPDNIPDPLLQLRNHVVLEPGIAT